MLSSLSTVPRTPPPSSLSLPSSFPPLTDLPLLFPPTYSELTVKRGEADLGGFLRIRTGELRAEHEKVDEEEDDGEGDDGGGEAPKVV
jgi:hypothetical protein